MDPLVVFIIADDRSGSTLLDYLLSCHPDAHSLGELLHLNDYYNKKGTGIERNWECSCGRIVQDCDFWKKIITKVSFSGTDLTRTWINESKWSFLNHLSHKFDIKKTLKNKTNILKGGEVAENCWKIYYAAAEQANRSVIIDSSKDAFQAYYLYKYRKGRVKFLLLERDIRAVVYSKMNRVEELKSLYGYKDSSLIKYMGGSYKILRRNRLMANIINSDSKDPLVKKVNYYELTYNLKNSILDICTFLRIPIYEPPLVTCMYDIEPHILGGSPSRYDKKPIVPDNRWKNFYRSKPFISAIGKILYQ